MLPSNEQPGASPGGRIKTTCTRRKKILLGIATFAPLVVSILMFGPPVVISCFYNTEQADKIMNAIFPDPFYLTIGISGNILALAMLVYYVRFLFNSDRVPKSEEHNWLLPLLFVAPFTMPILWYRYIWREPHPPRH